MLTKKERQTIAEKVVTEHGMMLAHALAQHDFSGSNLVALMELYASELDAQESPFIVQVIDKRMGASRT